MDNRVDVDCDDIIESPEIHVVKGVYVKLDMRG